MKIYALALAVLAGTAATAMATVSPSAETAEEGTVTLTLTETAMGSITVQLAGDATVITGAWEQETVVVVTPGTTTVTSALVQTVTDGTAPASAATPTPLPDADASSDNTSTEAPGPTTTAATDTESASTLPGSPAAVTADSAGTRLSPLNFKVWYLFSRRERGTP